MKLQYGQPAPTFDVMDVLGNRICLANFADKKILLSFFRYGSCAMCNLQVHKLIGRYDEYRKQGMEIIAVFESPTENIIPFAGKQNPPFPLIADPQARLYDLYGVESSPEAVERAQTNSAMQEYVKAASELGYELKMEEGANFFRAPADFLIAPGLVIDTAHYTDHIFDHLPFEAIDTFAAEHVAA